MSSSMPPPPGGQPQQPGSGPQFSGQGSPHPPAPQQPGQWQPQSTPLQPQPAPGNSPYGAPSPNGGYGGPSAPQFGPGPQFASDPQFPPGSYQAAPGPYAPAQQPPKDFVVAWLLALFLGVLGVDRFYRGFLGLGVLKLLTCGGAGIWALIDLLLIVLTGGRDSTGQQLAGYEKHKKVALIVTPIVVVLGLILGSINSATGGQEASDPSEASVAAAPAAAEEEPAEVAAAEAAEASADEPAEPADEPGEPAVTADDEAEEPAAEAAADEPADAPVEQPVAADVPATQQAMTDAVARARSEAESAETDLQRANVLNVRSDTLCTTVPDGAVQGWIGTVRSVDANGEGKAVVVLGIEDDIEIATWNNAFSDLNDNTLIEQGTELYDAALALAPGDAVQFSGTLKSGSEANDACYYTSNLTETMSIDSPDFIINFSDLQKVG